ncbi:DHH family phosphoesterase [Patescibacteria group bacterium]|nr:DHH family phosphoesterase [Patescibacteria group bacterium]
MIKHLETIQKIKQAIDEAKNILAITHQKPDGDGLGAICALASYLTSLRKNYQLFCLDPVPDSGIFLPLAHQITADRSVFNNQYDLIIILDSGDLQHAGIDQLLENYKHQYTLVNIDHHITNQGYGDLNLVLAEKSSVSEIVYNLFHIWHFPICKEVATALLNGIIFDTGAFSNAATSLSSLEAASHLLNLGARHKEINESQIRNKSLGLLKLWGRAFERLTYNPHYDLAFTVITQQDIKECQASPEATEGIANFFNELAGAKIALVLKEEPDGQIKGSLRTTYDDIDVGQLAKNWGGGGHKKAAGFSVKGRLVYNENRWKIV